MTVIATQRLILRPLRAEDIPALIRELNTYAIARNTARVPWPYGAADAREFLAFAQGLDTRSLVSGIELKHQPGLLKGVVSYEWSAAKGDAELGYWLSQSLWGQGFGREAAAAAVDHAFAVNGHPRLVACYHDGNEASRRILEGLGFERVGACSAFSKAQGADVPVTNLALTRERWRSRAR
jgi:RimJ/RimL family protein N-acetyltransferase